MLCYHPTAGSKTSCFQSAHQALRSCRKVQVIVPSSVDQTDCKLCLDPSHFTASHDKLLSRCPKSTLGLTLRAPFKAEQLSSLWL